VVSGSINQYSEQKIAHCMATAVCGVSPGTRGDSVSNSGRGTENCDRGASTTWSTAQEEDMSEPWWALQSMATVCKQRLAGRFIRSGLKPGYDLTSYKVTMRAFLSVALEHCPEMKLSEPWEAVQSRARDCKASVKVEVWVTGQVNRGTQRRTSW
jgi:hypothetical protein